MGTLKADHQIPKSPSLKPQNLSLHEQEQTEHNAFGGLRLKLKKMRCGHPSLSMYVSFLNYKCANQGKEHVETYGLI